MTIGDCNVGDIVWIFDNVFNETIQIRVLDNSTDAEFLMPRKKVEILETCVPYNTWLNELFYTVICYKTKSEAEEAGKTIQNRYENHDTADSFATLIFANKQSKIDCMESFIKRKNLWKEYKEFEETRNKNLKHLDPFIEELKNYGQK